VAVDRDARVNRAGADHDKNAINRKQHIAEIA
jgi:hypothetical protein